MEAIFAARRSLRGDSRPGRSHYRHSSDNGAAHPRGERAAALGVIIVLHLAFFARLVHSGRISQPKVMRVIHAVLLLPEAPRVAEAPAVARASQPIGEALIMTAFGLAVAIPAGLAYNFFARAARNTLSELNSFAHDVFVLLATGVKPDGRQGDPRATGEWVLSQVEGRTARPRQPASRH